MLHALLDLLRRDMDKKLALAFPTPALRKRREGQGTHCVGDASEIKSLGHPPSYLRFLQGWAAMLHALLDLRRRDMDKKLALAFPTPALRKRREGQGTHCVGDASEIKSLGHPPSFS